LTYPENLRDAKIDQHHAVRLVYHDIGRLHIPEDYRLRLMSV